MNNNDYEPYVTPEQETQMNLLSELSDKFQKVLSGRRKKALEKLINEDSGSELDRNELGSYFLFRMDPDAFTVQSQNGEYYSFTQLGKIAKSLREDPSFEYNDADIVMNNLDPFYESVTLDDVVLAYHYYRLSKDDESLSHLVKMIGLYSQYVFETDGLRLVFPPSVLTHDESLQYFGRIVTFVDRQLKEFDEVKELYRGQYELRNGERFNLASRIDQDASWSIGMKNASEVRFLKILAFLRGFGDLDDFDVFQLERLFDRFYKKNGIKIDMHQGELSRLNWPVLHELYEFTEKRFERERNDLTKRSYKHILDILGAVREKKQEMLFNAEMAVTEEDINEAERYNHELETESKIVKLQDDIWMFFLIIMAVDEIPEFFEDKVRTMWRKTICRTLCDIYREKDAYDKIQEDDRINIKRIVDNERKIDNEKENLFRSFLGLLDSSNAETIMKKRHDLLDTANFIARDDISSLEDYCAKILELIQRKVQDENQDITLHVKKLEEEINKNRTIKVSEDVILTLATAELLYKQYATEQYAKQGFDYSSISALYYQAFEKAYNELIWGKYAHFLNEELEIAGTKYRFILLEHMKDRKKFRQEDPGRGYLPSSSNDYLYYVGRQNKTGITPVDATVMYSSFARFIGNEKEYNEKKISGFYGWLSSSLQFAGQEEMTSNENFMSIFNKFRTGVKASVDRRNEASHGGNEISRKKCIEDRKTILSKLKHDRDANIGLIHQLINIVNFNKNA